MNLTGQNLLKTCNVIGLDVQKVRVFLFEIENKDASIDVFTTRPDTICGTTFLVLSPEHSLVNEITSEDKLEAVKNIKKTHLKNLTLSVQI